MLEAHLLHPPHIGVPRERGMRYTKNGMQIGPKPGFKMGIFDSDKGISDFEI